MLNSWLKWVVASWLRMSLAVLSCSLYPALCTAAPALVLDGAAKSLEAWPAVTLLSDPSHRLTVQDVLVRASEFQVPRGAYANLGVRRDAAWLKLPVSVPRADDGHWVLNINYSALTRVDVHLVENGQVRNHLVLGDHLPFSKRAMPTRTPAAPLVLEPGRDYEVLLRIESTSSMVLPISLTKAERFHLDEARIQMLQGLLTGVGLCLMVYSLAQWVSARDRVFIHYAIEVFGTTLFFFVHFGFAQQYLWPNAALPNFSAAAALIALVGGFLFTERVLDIRSLHPLLGRLMVAGSVVAGGTVLAFLFGVIGYPAAQLTATALGPWPLLLALPAAFVRARRGEKVARYVLVGWSLFAMSTIVFVSLLRGLVPANFWTRHVFQLGTIFEICVWMRVLAIRIEEIRQSMQQMNLERDALRLLAHTDPLTGLLNRRGLSEAVRAALPACTAQQMMALYMLDLDGFKLINDRFGHEVGDELLVAVSKRLKATVRGSDLVARLGGDEFVVMAQGLAGEAEAQRLGQALLGEFRQEFEINGHSCRVGATVGYALAPVDGVEIGVLLKHADAAMYSGKQAGRQCLQRGARAEAAVAEQA